MSVHTPSGPADGTETAPQLRPPGDGALFLIAVVAFAAVVAWGAAITLAVARLFGHTDLAFAVLLVGAAVTLTLSAVHLRLDLSRRRRLGKALDHIASCFAAAQAEQVEHLGALAREVEALTVKLDWNAWAAGLPGDGASTPVTHLHPRHRGDGA